MIRSKSRCQLAEALLISLLAAACEQEHGSRGSAAETPAEVAWFQGSPAEAFAFAKAEGRPLFLYWGAEWCPPCHYLKDKIFQEPDFVKRSRDFVAVYLDGDDEGAQTLGERLHVEGYPTVMVHSAEGEELLRMPSYVPVSSYEAIMQRALRLSRPIQNILAGVLEDGPAVSDAADLDVLAYSSWRDGGLSDLPESERLATLERLWEETPSTHAGIRTRFLGLYLGEILRLTRRGGDEAPLLAPDRRHELVVGMMALLSDADLRRENLDISFDLAAKIDLLTPEPGHERTALIHAWRKAVLFFEKDEQLSTRDRLTAVIASIDLERLEAGDDEAPLSEELVEHVRKQVVWAVGAVSGGSELQTVLETATYILKYAGLVPEARELLAHNLAKAKAPYYFMSMLAELKSAAGESDAALALYRQAWQSAGGHHAGFRWGVIYLRQLMALAPERVEAIEADSLTILDELLTHDDAFAGGNNAKLWQLTEVYVDWNESGEHDEVIDRIRGHVREACGRYPGDGQDLQQDRCQGFLNWDLSFDHAMREPMELSEDYLNTLAGDYGERHIQLKEGKLYYSRTGTTSGDRELIPLSEYIFVLAEIPSFRIRFDLDDAGRPVKIVGLYAGGFQDESPQMAGTGVDTVLTGYSLARRFPDLVNSPAVLRAIISPPSSRCGQRSRSRNQLP